jgi:molybdenum cofactor cytidylyltransferase
MHAGLVLAAGAGTRFAADRSKLLAEFRGRPLLEHAVAAACAVAALERVVVVLGARASEIRSVVDFGRAEVVECEDWASGQSRSLACGARVFADAGTDRVIVTLGDAPLVGPAVIARFVGQRPRARAVYGGRPGHPVVLGPDELGLLLSLAGDVGARELLAGGPRIECADLGRGDDIDTLSDLEAMHDEARSVI